MTPNPSVIYLNNTATTWPKPGSTGIGHAVALPSGIRIRITGSLCKDLIHTREHYYPNFLTAESPQEYVVFTQNATDFLKILILGFFIGKETGCHILTTIFEQKLRTEFL
jgi:cysteine desulfurase / selenocysteine lyase